MVWTICFVLYFVCFFSLASHCLHVYRFRTNKGLFFLTKNDLLRYLALVLCYDCRNQSCMISTSTIDVAIITQDFDGDDNDVNKEVSFSLFLRTTGQNCSLQSKPW